MPQSVRFQQLRPWALVPTEYRVDRSRVRDDARTYRESFRFVRAERRPELCPPWVMGQELGWRINSPIDIQFTPLDQVEVIADDAEAAGSATGRSELWKRERSHLAVHRSTWLHLYQYETQHGWENMFVPNGLGTVEWRLGWAADIPRGYFLLMLASERAGSPEVPTGILSSTAVSKMNNSGGLSVAMRPTNLTIARGQEIARLILLHADSLQATATGGETLTSDD